MLFHRVKQQTASLYDTSQSVRSCMTWTTSTISSLTGRSVLLIACSDDFLPVRLRSGFEAVCVYVNSVQHGHKKGSSLPVHMKDSKASVLTRPQGEGAEAKGLALHKHNHFSITWNILNVVVCRQA